jgi:phage host-nuclease inhibitor protein Gam
MKKADIIRLTRDEISDHVGRYTEAKIRKDKLTARQNKELDEIRARYEEQLQACDESMKENRDVCEKWADAHPEQFAQARSLEFARGTIGYQLGKPAFKARKGNSLEVIIRGLQATNWGRKFVKVVAETLVDKEALIAARDTITAEQRAEIGFDIVQEDRFYIDPRQDEPAEVVS